jgi:hypothetical protein
MLGSESKVDKSNVTTWIYYLAAKEPDMTLDGDLCQSLVRDPP